MMPLQRLTSDPDKQVAVAVGKLGSLNSVVRASALVHDETGATGDVIAATS